MKLLSLKEVELFDYVKTRDNVLNEIKDLSVILLKYRNVLPPSLAYNLFDIRVQSFPKNTSPQERYLERKEQFREMYEERLTEIEMILDDMSLVEKIFFKEHFIHGLDIKSFEKRFNKGPDAIEHLKKSSVIKFAIALDIAVYKPTP